MLPIDLLFQLPFKCFYIRTAIIEEFDGFFFWLEYARPLGAPEIRIQMVGKDFKKSLSLILNTKPGGTFRECFYLTVAESERYTVSEGDLERIRGSKDIVLPYIILALQFVFYLLSDAPDIDQTNRRYGYFRSRALRGNKRQVAIVPVGVRIGAAIRRGRAAPGQQGPAAGEPTGRTVVPHMRRAHWHHFWTGPRREAAERRLVLRWIPPVFVNSGPEELTTTIYPVKK